MREKLFDLYIDNIGTGHVKKILVHYLNSNSNHLVYFINAHCYTIAHSNKVYRNALKQADIVLNDGIGIRLAAKLNGIRLVENMNGTDLIPEILPILVEQNSNIFLLGSKPGIVDKAKESIERNNPGINIVGVHHGYFNSDEVNTIINLINEAKPDVLIVGMGVPRQELFLNKNKRNFTSVRISIAAGAVLDFQSGIINRAPNWMIKANVEWFFRFLNEPKRLFSRYFIGGFKFIGIVFRKRFFSK